MVRPFCFKRSSSFTVIGYSRFFSVHDDPGSFLFDFMQYFVLSAVPIQIIMYKHREFVRYLHFSLPMSLDTLEINRCTKKTRMCTSNSNILVLTTRIMPRKNNNSSRLDAYILLDNEQLCVWGIEKHRRIMLA